MGKRKAPDDSSNTNSIPVSVRRKETVVVPTPSSSQTPNTTEVGSSSQPASDTEGTEPTPASTTEAEVNDKKKHGRVRSTVWLEFTRISDAQARCHHCEQLYAADVDKDGTSGLHKHLRRCLKIPKRKVEKDKGQQTLLMPPPKPGEEGKLVSYSYSYEKLRRALVEWIIKDEHPFRAVEGSGFVAMMKVAEPRFKVPGRMTIYRDVLKMYVAEKNKLKTYFLTSKQRVSLTTDTWTSPNNYNYICVTVHYVDPNWKLQKKILMFCQVDGHTGNAIGEKLVDCLKDWGLQDVFGVTLGNVSANKVAIGHLKDQVIKWTGSPIRAKYLHVRCAAHVLALVIRDAVRLFNVSVRRIRAVVKYVLSSPSRLEKFKQCASLAKVDCTKSLILDVLTRWNSTYLMLAVAEKYEKVFELLAQIDKDFQERFIFEQRKELVLPTDADVEEAIASNAVMEDAFEDIEEEEEVENMEEEVEELDPTSKNKEKMKNKKRKIPRQHAPYQEDWNYARGLVKFLKVFFDVTVNFSASTQVTTHMFLWQLLLVNEKLVEFRNNVASDPFIARMSRLMCAKYHKYWGVYESMNSVMFIAHLLDPIEKQRGLEFTLNCLYDYNTWEVQRVMRKVKLEFEELFEDYKSLYSVHEEGSSSDAHNVANPVSVQSCGLFARIKSRRQNHWNTPSCVEEARTTELDGYLTDVIEGGRREIGQPDQFDILAWWEANASRYKILSYMARDILAMPVSSVASESAFSTGKRVLTPRRSSMSTRTVEALLCTQSYLQKPIALDLMCDYAPDDDVEDEEALWDSVLKEA